MQHINIEFNYIELYEVETSSQVMVRKFLKNQLLTKKKHDTKESYVRICLNIANNKNLKSFLLSYPRYKYFKLFFYAQVTSENCF